MAGPLSRIWRSFPWHKNIDRVLEVSLECVDISVVSLGKPKLPPGKVSCDSATSGMEDIGWGNVPGSSCGTHRSIQMRRWRRKEDSLGGCVKGQGRYDDTWCENCSCTSFLSSIQWGDRPRISWPITHRSWGIPRYCSVVELATSVWEVTREGLIGSRTRIPS